MSGYQPIQKRTSSPFSTRDQIKQKQLQKQTERILLSNQRSNQSIVTKLQANIDSTNSHTNTSPQISPRSKVSNESFRITTLTSLKRESSPESLRNIKQKMNPTSSPSIPSLAHIPQEQQDHINLTHKINSKSNSISNNGGCPQYEETPKFKINKTENVLSFLHRPFGSSYLEEDNSSKEEACGSCFSFGHEVSRDEDKIVTIAESTPKQTSLTTLNNHENGCSSQVQHIQQGTTKKHVSFCPQIDQSIEQVEDQQRNPQYQLITLKSCLGDKQQSYHKYQQFPNIDQPIEIRDNIIINQPIFESFAPQANFSSNQGFNSQLEIVQSQPQELQELTNPTQEQKKALVLPLRIRKESIIEEILVEDASKMEGNSKLNMLRERMVKPQADSTIAKYIKASCIKKASSLEFIDIPSEITENAKKNEENEKERIPLLIHQLKSNLASDSLKVNDQIRNNYTEKHENDLKQNQQDNYNQQINGYQDAKIELRNGQDYFAAFNISKDGFSSKNTNTLEKLKQNGEIINHFETKNYEIQPVHNNTHDEILFQQPITAENSEKLESATAAVLLGDRNQKSINNLKKSNTNSNYLSQDSSAYNGDNTLQAFQKINTPTCKTAVISLNIKPFLSKEGFQAQQQTPSEEQLPQQVNIYTGTIHLEPLITESKISQMSPIKKSADSTQGSFNRIDNLSPPPIEIIGVSQTPTMSLDLKAMTVKVNEDSKNELQFSNDDGSSSYSNPNNTSKNKQALFIHNSPLSSTHNNNTTMASNDETVISLYSSEIAASSSPQSQEYFTSSYLKPSPMPIINCSFANNLNQKSSNISANFNTNNKMNKQDPSSSPVTSYLPSPKKQSKKQPMDSLELDSSLDFQQKNLAQEKSSNTFSRPQPASQPSPTKAYSQFIRQSFFQQPSSNHNFNHSQENIHEDNLRSKQKVLSSSSYVSQSSSLIRSSSPSKLKQNPYDIQPQTVKSATKIVIEKRGDISSKINAIPQHKPSYSYSLKPGYSTKTTNDTQFKTPNRVISSKTSGSTYISQTKIEQEFSYYQLSQTNLEKGQTPQSQSSFNSEVSLPFH